MSKLNDELQASFGVEGFFDRKERVVLTEVEGVKVVVRDDEPVFFYAGDKIVPMVRLLLQKPLVKQVVVDMGAVRFMSSGADVMRPGIVHIDEGIAKGDIVVVVDETHKKPLCVAEALFSGEEMKAMDKGKVLKNLHYVGDKLWKAF